MDTKKFVLLISAMTAVICALTVVYNFASMPAYGNTNVSAVALYARGNNLSSIDSAEFTSEDGTSDNEADDASSGGGTSTGTRSSKKSTASSKKTTSHSKTTSSKAKATPSNPVGLNSASLEQLETVPYIGAARAQDIINYRSTNGAFSSIDDLDKVKGFGKKMIEKVRPYLTLN